MLDQLTMPGLPAIAVIGGMAVNIRLSTTADAHRATQDIDLVADQAVPTAVEVLSHGHEHGLAREHTVLVDGVEIDIIETHAIRDDDLDGLDDDARLFVAGHRWALETAGSVRITTAAADGPVVEVPVATPAGLIAAKSHAAGYPRAARRATKHGGDLYDIFRLVEVFDTRGEVRAQLAAAPGGIGRLVARVVEVEILNNAPGAMRRMRPAASTRLDVPRIVDVLEPLVSALS